jgi:hypothetical protein
MLKFGRNVDADTGDDVWDGSAAYPFPAAAAETTIVSDSADDAAAGTGARTVTVYGLDANYLEITETVTLNGLTPVTLTKQYLRLHRGFVATAGSGGVNAGNLQLKHSSIVITQISAGYGQTLMSIYTLPADVYGWLASWRGSSDGSVAVKLALQTRPYGGAWNTKDVLLFDATGNSLAQIDFAIWQRFAPKTDFRVRVITGGNGVDVAAQFDLALNRGLYLPRNLGGVA